MNVTRRPIWAVLISLGVLALAVLGLMALHFGWGDMPMPFR